MVDEHDVKGARGDRPDRQPEGGRGWVETPFAQVKGAEEPLETRGGSSSLLNGTCSGRGRSLFLVVMRCPNAMPELFVRSTFGERQQIDTSE
jgi:hypothetical protein